MSRLLDHIRDWQDRDWYVNDHVAIVYPGVVSLPARIVECTSTGIVRVELDSGGFTHARTSELQLIRRRTADEVPL